MANSNAWSAVWLFVGAFALGTFMSWNSWQGQVVLTGTKGQFDGRIPAAIGKVFDVSNLQGTDLLAASQERILKVARILREEGRIGVSLGHFITRNENGQKLLACQFYDWIEIKFQAEGLASNGQVPEMVVEGPCDINDDVNYMNPLWIPVKQITETKPGDAEWSFGDNNAGLKFRDIIPQGALKTWPNTWVLKSVRLFSKTRSERMVEVNQQRVLQITPAPLTIIW